MDHLDKYKAEGFNNVDGWVDHGLFDCVRALSDCGINKKGGITEIGVHHGRFYILLNSVVEDATDRSFAIDVFEDQHLNIDHSGNGSLGIFKDNLKKYDKFSGINTVALPMDSTAYNGCIPINSQRFVSIDGGHTVEHAINDLKLSEGIVANEGVVILDDIFHIGWPGVTEGYIKYSMTHPVLMPFAMGFNKLFLAKVSYVDFYRDLFAKKFGSNFQRFCNHQLVRLG
jgi:hypothetical protein